ncbi:MAG: hypothetical protein KAR06_07530, partial [Deltaproteobacteria bacterium]|nr:hypothetical protein [Deltaproteobacteria bacterium]
MSKHSKSTTKKAIDSAKDPYLNVEAPADNSICSGCEALFHNKHWRFPEEEELKELKGAPRVSCPACKKISDGYAGGYVTIKGDFQKEHKDELITLIKKN